MVVNAQLMNINKMLMVLRRRSEGSRKIKTWQKTSSGANSFFSLSPIMKTKFEWHALITSTRLTRVNFVSRLYTTIS